MKFLSNNIFILMAICCLTASFASEEEIAKNFFDQDDIVIQEPFVAYMKKASIEKALPIVIEIKLSDVWKSGKSFRVARDWKTLDLPEEITRSFLISTYSTSIDDFLVSIIKNSSLETCEL